MQRKLSDASHGTNDSRSGARMEGRFPRHSSLRREDVLPLMREWIDHKMPEEDLHEDDFGVIGLDRKRDLRKHEVA